MQPNKPAPPTLQDADSKRNAIVGNLLILVATIFFGVNIPALKILMPEWITGQDAAAIRIGGGTVCMWIASAFIKNSVIERKDWLKIILGGAIGLFMFMYLFCVSLRYASPVTVSIILTLPPIFVIFGGAIFLHRKLSARGLLGAFLGLAGAALVILLQPHESHIAPDPLKGSLLAIGSAVCYAFYLMILEGPSKKYKTITLMRWVFMFAAIAAIPLYFALPKAALITDPHWTPWLIIAFIVLCPTFLSYLMIPPAIKKIGSKMVSLYQYLVPVVALLASLCVGLDHLRWEQPIAILIIIIGMLITNRANRKQIKKGNP